MLKAEAVDITESKKTNKKMIFKRLKVLQIQREILCESTKFIETGRGQIETLVKIYINYTL